MKLKLLVLVFASVLIGPMNAQEPEPIPAEELAKIMPALSEENTRLGDRPMKLELSPGDATGFRAKEVGAIFIPDKRFKAEKGDRTDKKKGATAPVGQLWTSKLSPLVKEAALANDKLQLVTVNVGDKSIELAVFTIGVEKEGKKGFQLALYGKDGVPVLRVPMTTAKSKGATPVVMSARKTGDESGVLEFKLLGRYKAEIPVGKQAG